VEVRSGGSAIGWRYDCVEVGELDGETRLVRGKPRARQSELPA
jgi:hypothetical protein